jgi:Domain of unknown function (DUF4136)
MTQLRIVITSLLLSLIGLLGSCANVKYVNDYKSDTDFSGLKTYNWRAVDSTINGLDATRLKQLANWQLQAQGFQFATDNPDMLIDLQTFTRQSTGGGTSIGIGLGLPVGNSGSIGLGTSQLLNKNKQEGVIVMDITKASSTQLIWRGNAEKIPLKQFNLKSEPQLSAVMARLVAQFPPKKP